MKLWFAAGSGVSLHRQMRTQIVLAILSGDLKLGEKLPSTRALAQRFNIHPNTVSSTYQQLAKESWLESRRGSGVYVKDRRSEPLTPRQMLDLHIASLFRVARDLGITDEVTRTRNMRWLAAPAPDYLLLIEPDEKLAHILVHELNAISTLPVEVVTPDACRADRHLLRGALPLCRPSLRPITQEAIGTGIELVVLPINSTARWLAPLVSSAPGRLIAVVSHWPEFIETARTLLLSAGVSVDALMLVTADAPNWRSGLALASAIVCDTYTASQPGLPNHVRQFILPCSQPLRSSEAEQRGTVTPSKASQDGT